MSWTLAFTAISALTTVGSTIMSIQQARANQKQIKANAAWRAYQNNLGIRIDHFLLSSYAMDILDDIHVDENPRKKSKTSDHAPIIASFNI